MNKGPLKKLTFLTTAAFFIAVGTLFTGISFYWFNFIEPSILSGEKTRAEMVLVQVTDKLEPILDKEDANLLEDMVVRLLLMKDPSTGQSLILGMHVETLAGSGITNYSDIPVEIAGPFAFTSPLYSPKTHEVLGEVSFQYNPYFYEQLVADARIKLFWLLGMAAGIIFLLQRVLLRLIRPLARLSDALAKIDFSQTPTLPECKGFVVSEIGEVVQSINGLFDRLEVSRKSERTAKDEMERAQAVSSTGSWVWDILTNALTWSEEIYRIVGMRPGEVEPDYQLFLDLIHPDDRSVVEKAVARAVAGEEEYDIVHRLIRQDGSLRFIREKSQVTFNENGEAIQMIGTAQDVTEQKLMEDLSLRFGRIMDEAFNEIYIIDESSLKFTQLNQSALQNIGYSMVEMSTMTPHDIAPDMTYEDMEALFQAMRDNPQSSPIIQSIHQRKDGTLYPVEVRLQLSRHDTPPQFIAIVQDITERQKAERAMQEAMRTLEARVQERTKDLVQAKEEAETYLDIAGSVIVSLNSRGEVDLINKQGCEVLGNTRNEIIGKNWFQNFIPERDREKVFQVFQQILQGEIEPVERYVNAIVNNSGEERLVEWHNSIIRNDRGEIEAVLSSGRDITEQEKAQEKLRQSEEKFRKYFELPLVGIAITSLEKGWLEVNDRLCEFFGYSREELTKMTWMELTYPEDLEADVVEFNKVLNGESEGYSLEKRFVNKSGEIVYAEISARCVRKSDGQVDYFVALVQDINDRKRAEQEMILAREEAERASNAKSEFLSQMSHELRTPLNAILGFGQVLESDPQEPLTTFQQQSVTEILKGGSHLLELINEILDLSRIETGHLTLSLESVNLGLLTEELITLCEPVAKKCHVELLNYVPLHDDLFVFADRIRLKQVLLNLVSNAIKYNRTGGTVKIDAGTNGMETISISITDTGVGIPEERMKDLFQPFNRLGSEKTEIEGTGVGLTITKQLVEKMNGRILVESQAGVGSTFTVIMPRGQPQPDPEALPAQHSSSNLDRRADGRNQWVILYVEDNPANLNLVRHIFRRRPEVFLLTAPDAKLGIELAEVHHPDLILMDINLPGIDGITAFKMLREMEETRNTPVIAISANAMPRDVKKALELGFGDYLTKPLDIFEFNRVVDETLQRIQELGSAGGQNRSS